MAIVNIHSAPYNLPVTTNTLTNRQSTSAALNAIFAAVTVDTVFDLSLVGGAQSNIYTDDLQTIIDNPLVSLIGYCNWWYIPVIKRFNQIRGINAAGTATPNQLDFLHGIRFHNDANLSETTSPLIEDVAIDTGGGSWGLQFGTFPTPSTPYQINSFKHNWYPQVQQLVVNRINVGVQPSTVYGVFDGIELKNSNIKYMMWNGRNNLIHDITNSISGGINMMKLFCAYGNGADLLNSTRGNKIYNIDVVGGMSETICFDSYSASTCCRATIASKVGTAVTLTIISKETYRPSTEYVGLSLVPLRLGGQVVSLNSERKGIEWPITGQTGDAASGGTLTVTDNADFTNLAVGDLVLIMSLYADNEIYMGTLRLPYSDPANNEEDPVGGCGVGIALFGACYNNYIHHMVVRPQNDLVNNQQGLGWYDIGLAWGLPNAGNRFEDCLALNIRDMADYYTWGDHARPEAMYDMSLPMSLFPSNQTTYMMRANTTSKRNRFSTKWPLNGLFYNPFLGLQGGRPTVYQDAVPPAPYSANADSSNPAAWVASPSNMILEDYAQAPNIFLDPAIATPFASLIAPAVALWVNPLATVVDGSNNQISGDTEHGATLTVNGNPVTVIGTQWTYNISNALAEITLVASKGGIDRTDVYSVSVLNLSLVSSNVPTTTTTTPAPTTTTTTTTTTPAGTTTTPAGTTTTPAPTTTTTTPAPTLNGIEIIAAGHILQFAHNPAGALELNTAAGVLGITLSETPGPVEIYTSRGVRSLQ